MRISIYFRTYCSNRSVWPYTESKIGTKRFIKLFFAAGILGNAIYLTPLGSGIIGVVGASGAILGVLGALTIMEPRLPVVLLGAIPMRLWVASLIFIIISLVGAVNAQAGIAHAGHLMGLLCGFIYGHHLKKQYVSGAVFFQ